jgi:hypothetical protein
MTIVPENKTVLCECLVEDKRRAVADGVTYEKEELPVYKVLAKAPDADFAEVGDEVVCNSTGTRLNVPGKGVQYLFKEENIACKIA